MVHAASRVRRKQNRLHDIIPTDAATYNDDSNTIVVVTCFRDPARIIVIFGNSSCIGNLVHYA